MTRSRTKGPSTRWIVRLSDDPPSLGMTENESISDRESSVCDGCHFKCTTASPRRELADPIFTFGIAYFGLIS
jgi:hypothetical protein